MLLQQSKAPPQRHVRQELLRGKPANSFLTWLGNQETATPSSALPKGVVVDRVEVDKSEVCRGEEVIVTIHARATDGGEAYLDYGDTTNPLHSGPRFSIQPDRDTPPGKHRVYVRGKSGASVMADVPPIKVKDCDAPLELRLKLKRKVEAQDRAWLTAEVLTRTDAAPFEPVQFEWNFGDGTRRTTPAGSVEHSYEARLQNTAYSYYFVEVSARDAQGRSVRGRQSVRFVNFGFLPLTRRDRVVIFSGVRKLGNGKEEIWLYHGSPERVHLGRVTVKESEGDESGSASVRGQSYDALSLLGIDELPPGESRVIRELDRFQPEQPGTSLVIEVSGRADDGKTADGAFTLVNAASDEASSSSPEQGT